MTTRQFCWVYVIFFACVCVGTSGLTTAFDDPSSSALCVMCAGRFLGGSQGGPGMPPLDYEQRSTTGDSPGQFLEIVFGWFLLFLSDFAIFSGFLN